MEDEEEFLAEEEEEFPEDVPEAELAEEPADEVVAGGDRRREPGGHPRHATRGARDRDRGGRGGGDPLAGPGGTPRDDRGARRAEAGERVRVPEVPPVEADPQPAGGSQADVLPGLRLIERRPPLAVALAWAALSGGLTWLANPPADLGPLAFVSLIPLLVCLRTAGARRGAALGFAFGIVYLGLLLRWLAIFGSIAEWPLVAVEAAFFAAACALTGPILGRVRGLGAPFLVAAVWTAAEWLRGGWPVGGFTWGGLGYTQHADPLVLPLASVAGVWGITFVVVAVNALSGRSRCPRAAGRGVAGGGAFGCRSRRRSPSRSS